MRIFSRKPKPSAPNQASGADSKIDRLWKESEAAITVFEGLLDQYPDGTDFSVFPEYKTMRAAMSAFTDAAEKETYRRFGTG